MLSIFQAESSSCKTVTVPHDILGRAAIMHDLDLSALSRGNVKMLPNDTAVAG
jgi:hypothetical protein